MALTISDKKFQFKLIALFVKNPDFLKRYRPALKPEWFETPELQALGDLIFAYYDEFHESPDWDTLEFLAGSIGSDKHSPDEWRKLVRSMSAHGDDGLAYVHDHVGEFIQYRAYKEAILLGARLLEEGRFDKIPQIIREAQKWDKESVPYVDFFEGIKEWLEEREIRQTIPTGITELDQILDGGTARGEITVILATPNVGKTTVLVNLGAAAVMDGKRVYHFHAEQSTGVIRARYTARISGIAMKELKDDPDRTARILEKIERNSKGRLLISKCARQNIGALRAFIYKHGTPDVIVIDYADKLVSPSKYSDRRHEIAAIYDEMVVMAEEFNCSILTASQAKREAVNKEKVTIQDLAEAFEKAAIADNVIAIAQTEEDRSTGIMRLLMAKIRNEEIGLAEIECRVFWKLMRIVSVADYAKQISGDEDEL
jgi:KaiC/GvpD/RAD55 family RecA-like ATPase